MKKILGIMLGFLLISSLVLAGNIRKDWNARTQIMGTSDGYQVFGANNGENFTITTDMNDTDGWEGALIEIHVFDSGGAATATGVSVYLVGYDPTDVGVTAGAGISTFAKPDISFEIDTTDMANATGATKTVLVTDAFYIVIGIANTTAADTPSVRVYESRWRWFAD